MSKNGLKLKTCQKDKLNYTYVEKKGKLFSVLHTDDVQLQLW